jgi:ribosome maturation factor RimP
MNLVIRTIRRLGFLERWTQVRARLFCWRNFEDMTLPLNIEAVLLPVFQRCGVGLVKGTFQKEGKGLVLRLLIERHEVSPESGSGVNVDLCAAVSRDVGAALDVGEIIPDTFTLEVSSPGIERPLVRLEDYDRFAGRKVTLKTKKSVEGKRRFTGMLKGLRGEAILITKGNGQTVAIPYEFVKKANLVF